MSPLVTACQSTGPSGKSVHKAAATAAIPGLRVVDVTAGLTQQLAAPPIADAKFADLFPGAQPVGTRVGIGDTVEVTIWEAAPAALFGTSSLSTNIGSEVQGSRPNTLPGFLVGPSGRISIPFAGQVPVAGRSTVEIERDIVRRLTGRAHLPQAVVRITRNVAATATVLGDVKEPSQVPLTPHGERVLDALSHAGGTSEPLYRMTVQLARGDTVHRMAARDIIADPRNNVVLKSGDVVTALYQPYSFTVLGAAGKNDEIRFEGVGLTLSQALGRIGGLQNDRADAAGVFIFRWEDPQSIATVESAAASRVVPVIYEVNLRRPETYFAAQKFQVRDGDVLFVSTSLVTDLQRFINVLASSILPLSTVRTITQ